MNEVNVSRAFSINSCRQAFETFPRKKPKKNCNKNDKEGKILLLFLHSDVFSVPFFLFVLQKKEKNVKSNDINFIFCHSLKLQKVNYFLRTFITFASLRKNAMNNVLNHLHFLLSTSKEGKQKFIIYLQVTERTNCLAGYSPEAFSEISNATKTLREFCCLLYTNISEEYFRKW